MEGEADPIPTLYKKPRDRPSGPVIETPHVQCRGCESDPWPGDKDVTCLLAQQKNKAKAGSVVKNLPAKAGDVGFDPRPGKTPCAAEQLRLRATATEPVCALEPRSHGGWARTP